MLADAAGDEAGVTGAERVEAKPIGLVDSLFDGVRQLIGDRAGYTMFNVAAQTEGRRLASTYRRDDIASLLARFDGMLEQKTQIVHHDPHVPRMRLNIMGHSRDSGNSVLDGVVLGLLEGAMGHFWGRPVKAKQEPGLNEDGSTTITLGVKTDD